MITSTHNPKIKTLAELRERKVRERAGRFLIEGAREIERALEAGLSLDTAVFCRELLTKEENVLLEGFQGEALEASPAPFKKLSSRENPTGLVMVAQKPVRSLAGLVLPQNPLVLIVVGLEKPGNLGALLRSADAAGADAILLVGGLDPYGPQAIRNSTGAVFSLKVIPTTEKEALAWLAARKLKLVAASPDAEKNYWQVDLAGALAIAVGSEDAGLPEKWLGMAATQVHIPMKGLADSLNVSVSAALLLYEALRQRTKSRQIGRT